MDYCSPETSLELAKKYFPIKTTTVNNQTFAIQQGKRFYTKIFIITTIITIIIILTTKFNFIDILAFSTNSIINHILFFITIYILILIILFIGFRLF